MKKYKYLVVSGCSMTFGAGCHIDSIFPKLLADRLGLKLINLGVSGTGWYNLETCITSFIHNNKDIVDECFFILQTSTLERRVNYAEIAISRNDVWENYNMPFVSKITSAALGFVDWMGTYGKFKPSIAMTPSEDIYNNRGMVCECNDIDCQLGFFPEHKHYPNSRHNWKGESKDNPPYIHEQLEGLMQHWGQRMSSFHLLLKQLNVDHIIVDGYTPFVSYKLNFENYFDTDDEFEFAKDFWSTKTDGCDVNDVMIYDFKNIKSGWLFDLIDEKYKCEDVVLWSLFQFKQHQTDWNLDGGHAGPLGMKLIENAIYTNLINKGWF